jgi:stage II sporulation protein D
MASVAPAHNITIPEIIDVRVFSGTAIRKFSFVPVTGRYLICNQNHEKLHEITSLATLMIERSGNGFKILYSDSVVFEGKSITLQGGAFQNSFLLVPQQSGAEARMFDGDLKIETDRNNLLLINSVPLESYVAGTVQSESGFNRHEEFYKVQAVIIRTYALNNLNRHAREGHNLCDQVHCQAYYGKTVNSHIARAVEATRGQLVADQDGRLINTVYHANCGGETVNSEDLWPHRLPYLRSRRDTFCLDMPGARWEKSISIREFRRFLTHQHNFHPNERQWDEISRHRQNHRVHHIDSEKTVHLRHVRDHFQLRSTYFSVRQEGENFVLTGKGYGHGVGLCQEGAMKRAQYGHSKDQILGFYYLNSRIITLEPEIIY